MQRLTASLRRGNTLEYSNLLAAVGDDDRLFLCLAHKLAGMLMEFPDCDSLHVSNVSLRRD